MPGRTDPQNLHYLLTAQAQTGKALGAYQEQAIHYSESFTCWHNMLQGCHHEPQRNQTRCMVHTVQPSHPIHYQGKQSGQGQRAMGNHRVSLREHSSRPHLYQGHSPWDGASVVGVLHGTRPTPSALPGGWWRRQRKSRPTLRWLWRCHLAYRAGW